MAIALADSLFLSISPDAARTKVLMFLAISIAPFAVIAPFVGPFIDRIRGGQRMVVIIVGLMRALVLVGMSQSLDSLTLFPLAFAALILGKTYAIAKSAIVPTLISDTIGLCKKMENLAKSQASQVLQWQHLQHCCNSSVPKPHWGSECWRIFLLRSMRFDFPK